MILCGCECASVHLCELDNTCLSHTSLRSFWKCGTNYCKCTTEQKRAGESVKHLSYRRTFETSLLLWLCAQIFSLFSLHINTARRRHPSNRVFHRPETLQDSGSSPLADPTIKNQKEAPQSWVSAAPQRGQTKLNDRTADFVACGFMSLPPRQPWQLRRKKTTTCHFTQDHKRRQPVTS